MKAPAEAQRIAMPDREGYEFVLIRDIVYCKANGSYTDLVLEHNKKLLLSKSLGEIEGLLPAELFERIHHSFLVNVQHINRFRKTAGATIIMDNGDEMSVAKSKKEQLLLRLGIK